MHMPLVVSLRLAPQDIPLAQDALSDLLNVTHTVSEHGLTICCPRSCKMEVLAAVSALGSKLIDLSLQEASLEDVFFGFSN
jgi:Cu-processing system ATP-binding protein